MKQTLSKLIFAALGLLGSVACASTTWYVDGIHGSDSNNCTSPANACKTIAHAMSLASSGDSIKVAAATYTENLIISINLKVIGAGASTTIIDGGGVGTVVTIPNSSVVTLANLTIRNGYASQFGGAGISNVGVLTVTGSSISGNKVSSGCTQYCRLWGGGIYNDGTLKLNNSTITGNSVADNYCKGLCLIVGGAIINGYRVIINNSTISGNSARTAGAIYNNGGTLTISSSTISGNNASVGMGGILIYYGKAKLQNSIVANNYKMNCLVYGAMNSNGYNLSTDGSCPFINTGDLNNTDPQLGPLQNNGGPTQTMELPSGSPAVDAGNPNGCTDNRGHLLTTDQRGMPRHDPEDSAGCDMGAYESQSD